jgi:hypothetical protein
MRRMPDGLGNVLQSPSHLLTNIAMLIIVNISCYGEWLKRRIHISEQDLTWFMKSQVVNNKYLFFYY